MKKLLQQNHFFRKNCCNKFCKKVLKPILFDCRFYGDHRQYIFQIIKFIGYCEAFILSRIYFCKFQENNRWEKYKLKMNILYYILKYDIMEMKVVLN